ncbi:MAG TPA: MraY family glycosyltransferase, partial [Thermoanaerobaculia bacterium]|nr:MraY family glycosyltransferase [Thermoanaerobaculia bacterium]
WPMTLLMRALGHRLRALDAPGVAGQLKAPARRVPNTGGIAIFLGIAAPIAAGLMIANTGLADVAAGWFEGLREHLAGIRATTPHALVLLGALLVLHVVGVVDDRKPLGPGIKLVIMLALALLVVWKTDTRLLVLLDSRVGGPWLSILLTVLWIGLVTNAMNFMDNMDGLAGGVGAIAASCFLAAAVLHGQWFVAAMLALLVGSLLGFLCFNFPRRGSASIFMGDGGSLVIGFLLAFLTVRTTFYSPAAAGGWYGVFMPLVVLAVPLYDFVSVSLIRISQGRSPFVGDLQHFSHRLVRRGLSKRDAVLVICGLTGITAIGGISLGSLQDWQAILVGVQTLLVLLVIALYERRAEQGTQQKA